MKFLIQEGGCIMSKEIVTDELIVDGRFQGNVDLRNGESRIQDFSIEDLYQMFKKRMKKEQNYHSL